MIYKQVRMVLVVAGAFFVCLGFAANAQAQQRQWCEENCRLMCRLTLKSGYTAAQCYSYINCAQFKGRPCASEAVVRERSRKYCQEKGTCAR